MPMVRVAVYILCCLTLLLSKDSKAQDEGRFTVYAGVGPAFTFGTLGHYSDLGYIATAGIGIKPAPVSSPELELVFRTQYAQFPGGQGSEIDYEYLTGHVDFKLNRVFARTPNTYMIVGIGGSRTTYVTRENAPLLSFGAGVESGWIVIEARVVVVFGEKIKTSTFLPLTLGVRF